MSKPAATPTPTPAPSSQYTYAISPADRDGPLLSVGKQCSASHCALIDFLPYTCLHCAKVFCSNHYAPQTHTCDVFDDRRAPACPLCNKPVVIPADKDANDHMKWHIDRECSATGQKAKKTLPVCGRPRCEKLLLVPVQCKKCYGLFCIQHGYATEHTCEAPSSSRGKTAQLAAQKVASVSQNLKTALASKAGGAVFKPSPPSARGELISTRSTSSTDAKEKAKATPMKSTPSSIVEAESKRSGVAKPASGAGMPNPFSKTDRRARRERESQRKALRERYNKGLLNPEARAKFEADEAQRTNGKAGNSKNAEGGRRKKGGEEAGCVVC